MSDCGGPCVLSSGAMGEPEHETNRLWTFPEGMLDPEDSLKGFSVEAADGDAGKVAWASYAPTRSSPTRPPSPRA